MNNMLLEGSRRPTGGGREGRSPLTFFENRKKCPDLEKCALLLCIYGLNSRLKCSFKSVLEKKHQTFSLKGL